MIEYKTLREISKFIRTGKTPPTANIKYFGGELNWYTPTDLDREKYLFKATRTLTELSITEKKAVVFPKDTLLIGCIGDIGKLGITTKESSSNQQITGILPNEHANVSYLYYWFRGNKHIISSIANNAVVPILNNGTLEKIKIPLPPLPVQQKIAAILDAADELRQKDKALLAKYEELTQALFLDMFGDPVSNPKGWEKIALKDCTSKIGSGSTPTGGSESYQEEGISLIRSLNVYDNVFLYKNLAHINEEQAFKLKNVTVESDDVLFNITGASVCRSTIVPNDVLPARVNQHVSILRSIKTILNPLFLSHLMISESTKKQLLSVGAGGGAVMEAITKEQLEKYKIPLPNLNLQTQFAERVKAIEDQKAIAQASAVKSEELFNSLLQKAFNGELV